MSTTVTIPKIEYQRLQQAANRLEALRKVFTVTYFEVPPTKSAQAVIAELRKTKRYNPAFLRSLSRGLREARYFSA